MSYTPFRELPVAYGLLLVSVTCISVLIANAAWSSWKPRSNINIWQGMNSFQTGSGLWGPCIALSDNCYVHTRTRHSLLCMLIKGRCDHRDVAHRNVGVSCVSASKSRLSWCNPPSMLGGAWLSLTATTLNAYIHQSTQLYLPILTDLCSLLLPWLLFTQWYEPIIRNTLRLLIISQLKSIQDRRNSSVGRNFTMAKRFMFRCFSCR